MVHKLKYECNGGTEVSRSGQLYWMPPALLLLGDTTSIDSKVTPICTGLEILFRRHRRRILG